MKGERKSFKKLEVVQKILKKMPMTEMARRLYPNTRNRKDALKSLNYWLNQEKMPVNRYEKMMDILEKEKDSPKPYPNRVSKKTKNTKPKTLDDIPRRTEEDFPIERYQTIASAIVGTAAADYTKAGVYMTKGKKNKHDEDTAERYYRECEQFFLGSQFPILMTMMDGESFKEKLDDKIRRGEVYKFVYQR